MAPEGFSCLHWVGRKAETDFAGLGAVQEAQTGAELERDEDEERLWHPQNNELLCKGHIFFQLSNSQDFLFSPLCPLDPFQFLPQQAQGWWSCPSQALIKYFQLLTEPSGAGQMSLGRAQKSSPFPPEEEE